MVEKPVKTEVNDEFAKTLGAESLENLRMLVTAQLKRELDNASRQKLKRELLDALEAAHGSLELPASLVEREFEGIWKQVTEGLSRENKTFADEGKTVESAREEYRKIAERRVRLGLVVGEIGDKNKIEVTQDELRRALMEQARRFPGQEKMVYEYFQKQPGALQELRAPIFEDKVVDYILELAKPVEKTVPQGADGKPREARRAISRRYGVERLDVSFAGSSREPRLERALIHEGRVHPAASEWDLEVPGWRHKHRPLSMRWAVKTRIGPLEGP